MILFAFKYLKKLARLQNDLRPMLLSALKLLDRKEVCVAGVLCVLIREQRTGARHTYLLIMDRLLCVMWGGGLCLHFGVCVWGSAFLLAGFMVVDRLLTVSVSQFPCLEHKDCR